MNEITEVTRREIIDYLIAGPHTWHGRLSEVEFLSRMFDLESLPTTDYRKSDYPNALQDIWQHRINNPGDWDDDWVFYDSRFELMHGPDERFLRFLCEMAHPVVRPDQGEATELVAFFNEHLAPDGWELVEKTRISDRPVYAARPLLAGAGLAAKAAKDVAFTLDSAYIAQQITRLEAAINSDPELAIGTAKEFLETVCKTILTERRVPHAKDERLPKLVKVTLNELKLLPDELVNTAAAADSVTLLLKNLTAIGHHLAELRNAFGTGHGKRAGHKGLGIPHARMAVGAASTLGVFLFECHSQGWSKDRK